MFRGIWLARPVHQRIREFSGPKEGPPGRYSALPPVVLGVKNVVRLSGAEQPGHARSLLYQAGRSITLKDGLRTRPSSK
jgi:hypothetical protein